MAASIEIAGAFIRLHIEGDYGDPYAWTCGLRADPEDITVALLGPVDRMPPPGHEARRALAQALHDKGFTRAIWRRRGRGERKPMAFEIEKYL